MRLFGYEFKRVRKGLSGPDSGHWFRLHDQYTGAWQQDVSVELESVLTFSTLYACVRLISTDIGKLHLRLMKELDNGIRVESESAAFSPVLRRPNHYQTIIKFVEQWVVSKLLRGNTYVLKGRDNRGIVTKLMVLDADRTEPLISDTGEVFYRLNKHDLAPIDSQVVVPATEIIHDVHVTPYHPLVGMGPVAAAGLTAAHGLAIQRGQSKFFENMSRPSGMLSAPGTIKQETAERLKTKFDENYGGGNIGKVLIGGDGLEFKAFSLSAVDSEVINQLKFTSEDVCRAFGVPAYKVGVGPMPTQANMAALNQAYYDDCLQELIECIEALLDDGLDLPKEYSTEFDLEGLLRMDPISRATVADLSMKAGWKAPNEIRARENLPPVVGGEEPIMQQQNWPLSVLAQRAPPDATPPEQFDGERALVLLNSKAAEEHSSV